ncbi:MAG: DUF2163 domain-containing protein [Novosphingobium sp.]|nr:DUF2163 domain-containing protein [Novosphingobium sp.]
MSRTWFSQPLETVATWWRIERRDGVSLGFTSHDRDIVFAGLRHRTAPGMVPSAMRKSATLELDTAEISGALSHDAISERDLIAGRFDGASITMGLVDWESLEAESLFAGTIGSVGCEGSQFSAELASLKRRLAHEIVPRTSPTCRAEFCGEGCTLSIAKFTHEAALIGFANERLWVHAAGVTTGDFCFGWIRPVEGPDAGTSLRIRATHEDWLVLERPLSAGNQIGMRVVLKEGCDHTLATCAQRFDNAINFQGEPFMPGNDLLTRYPAAQR